MTLEIQQQESEITALLKGRLDTLASMEFARQMQPLMDGADKHIVLDCAELEFISSSGLRLFLTLRKETIARGGSVTICHMTDAVKAVFSMTGFFALFEFA